LELGFSAKVTEDSELAALGDICRSVIEGRLIEKRRGRTGSRWRLKLSGGAVEHGSANWPPWPWLSVIEERFAPYSIA
jgi:hypothetical protein